MVDLNGLVERPSDSSPLLRGRREMIIPTSDGETIRVEVWSVRLDDARADDRIASTLSESERSRASRFSRVDLRRRYERCRVALREILGRRLGEPPDRLRIDRHLEGKPYLPDFGRLPDEGLQFNLSHSGDQAVIALVEDATIGIDIERCEPNPRRLDLARRFFAPEESDQLFGLPEPLRMAAFYRGWTCKEALIKGLGGGLRIPLKNFVVDMDPREPPRLRKSRSTLNLGRDPKLSTNDQTARFSEYAIALFVLLRREFLR